MEAAVSVNPSSRWSGDPRIPGAWESYAGSILREGGHPGGNSHPETANLWAWRVESPRFTGHLVVTKPAAGAGLMMRTRRQ